MGRLKRRLSILCILAALVLSYQNCSRLAVNNVRSFNDLASQEDPLKPFKILPASSTLKFSNCFGYSNVDSVITWCGSYEMMGYLSLYRANGDINDLLQFLVYAENVISQRDDKRDYSNRDKVWSQTNFSKGVPYPSVVGDGMITYPLADFAALVLVEEPALKAVSVKMASSTLTLEQIARRYLADVQANLAYHEAEWMGSGYKALPNTASYLKVGDSDEPLSNWSELPFNMSMAMGRTIISIARITNDANLKDRVDQMWRRWRSSVVIGQKGEWSWPYYVGLPDIPEDISHGAIDVDFLRLAYEHSMAPLTVGDLKQIVRTFTEQMYYKEGLVTYHVNGATPWETLTTHSEYSFRHYHTISWVMLSSYDEELKRIAIDASRLVVGVVPTHGYQNYMSALMQQFGGQTYPGVACLRNRDCFSNRCVGSGSSGRVCANFPM